MGNDGEKEGVLRKKCRYDTRRGNRNWNWKGGLTVNYYGYLLRKLQPDDFFYPMCRKEGYVLEHRLVMAKHLNRCLLSWEIVHHKGTKYPQGSKENRIDNRIENLELLPSQKYHTLSILWQREITKRDKRIKQLEMRVTLLEAELVVLHHKEIITVLGGE